MEFQSRLYRALHVALFCMFTLLPVRPSVATTLHMTTVKCPVGGEEFQDIGISSYSTFGSRPDGKPYGTLEIFPMHECPSNGFVIFDENFTPEEIKKLERVVSTIEYKKVSATETPYYRAYWLANAIGRDTLVLSTFLLQASWEVDSDPVQKKRYQQRFASVSDSITSAEFENNDAFWLALRNANVHRELGRFEQAKHRLYSLLDPLFWPSDSDELSGAAMLIKGLSQLIEEKNVNSDPVNFMPEAMGYFHCKDNPVQTGVEAESCRILADLDYKYEPEDIDYDRAAAEAAAEAADAAATAADAAN